MKIFYTKKGIVTAQLDEKDNAIVVNWDNLYDGQIFKECCMAQLEKIEAGVKALIINIKNSIGFPPQETTEWLKIVYIPELMKAGLKAIIIVEPQNSMTRSAYQLWLKIFMIGKNTPKFAMEVSDIEEALKKINELS